MSARIEIDMGLNATGVARGAKDAEKAIKDLEDAVGDVGSESSSAGRQVDSFADKVAKAAREAGKSEDEIKDALKSYGVNAKEAQRAIDRTADEFDDLGDAAKDAGRDGERAMDDLEDKLKRVQREADDTDSKFDKIGGTGKKSFLDVGNATSEFKDEALQNLSEVASSFDGSMESIVDLAQGTLGGVASSIPGIGIAAAGAAATIGFLASEWQRVDEITREATDSAFEYAYAAGGAMEAFGYSERLAEWTGDTEKFAQAQDIAKVAGQDLSDVLDTLASGDPQGIKDLTDAMAENSMYSDLTVGRLRELEGVLDGTVLGWEKGTAAAEANSRVMYDHATAVGTATGEVDDLGNAIYKLPDNTEVVVNAETQTANANVDHFEGEVAALPKDHTTTLNAVTNGLSEAQNAVNRFVASNDGRSFRLHGRVTVDSGWDS